MTASPDFNIDALRGLHGAAIDAHLDRGALLSGLEVVSARFPVLPDPSSQILSDLHQLNGLRLADGSAPMRGWLGNAIALTRLLPEQALFLKALQQLDRPIPTRPEASTDPSLRRPVPWTSKKWWGQRQAEVDVSLPLNDCYRAVLVAGNTVDHWRIVSLSPTSLRWEGVPFKRSWGHDIQVTLLPVTAGVTHVQFELTQLGHVVGEEEWEAELRLLLDVLNRHLVELHSEPGT